MSSADAYSCGCKTDETARINIHSTLHPSTIDKRPTAIRPRSERERERRSRLRTRTRRHHRAVRRSSSASPPAIRIAYDPRPATVRKTNLAGTPRATPSACFTPVAIHCPSPLSAPPWPPVQRAASLPARAWEESITVLRLASAPDVRRRLSLARCRDPSLQTGTSHPSTKSADHQPTLPQRRPKDTGPTRSRYQVARRSGTSRDPKYSLTTAKPFLYTALVLVRCSTCHQWTRQTLYHCAIEL